MTIHGKDRVFISGVETLLQELNDGADAGLSNCVYVTCGMDIREIYALFFRHPPEHYAIFITSERHFEAINRLFPGLLKLCLSEVDGRRAASGVKSDGPVFGPEPKRCLSARYV